MNYKELKKIADACRKLGIKHYKSAEFEFTLSDSAPQSNYKKQKTKSYTDDDSEIRVEDTISDEDLLFWSTVEESTAKNEDN
jgi:glutamine synthetase